MNIPNVTILNGRMVTMVRVAMLMALVTAVGAGQAVSAASAADASPETIRIATFNIKVFGPTKAGKPDVMSVLAGIVRKYDIVAVQEIKDRKRKVPGLSLDEINDGRDEYGVLSSERTGKQVDDRYSLEQYAYYYRKSTIAVLDEGGLYDDSGSDHFQREPFVARFVAKAGNFTFAMVNRRITALLRAKGWHVNARRVQRIWRREGLKVPRKQYRRSSIDGNQLQRSS